MTKKINIKKFLIKNQKGIEAMTELVEIYEAHDKNNGQLDWGNLLGHCVNNHEKVNDIED